MTEPLLEMLGHIKIMYVQAHQLASYSKFISTSVIKTGDWYEQVLASPTGLVQHVALYVQKKSDFQLKTTFLLHRKVEMLNGTSHESLPVRTPYNI